MFIKKYFVEAIFSLAVLCSNTVNNKHCQTVILKTGLSQSTVVKL